MKQCQEYINRSTKWKKILQKIPDKFYQDDDEAVTATHQPLQDSEFLQWKITT